VSKLNLPILHSSIEPFGTKLEDCIILYGNGIICAFQQDLHFVLRPDDVRLAVMTQCSFYVNAEELRDEFVNHKGKEELEVIHRESCWPWGVGDISGTIMSLMQEKMVDKEVQDWIMPRFSTITDIDMAISSMVMMATMREQTNYVLIGGCGFPPVTLQGEAADWEMILTRLDKFAEYGTEPATWSSLLKPVIKRFIATFYLPDSTELKEFWMRALHSAGNPGSDGPLPTLDGWMAAFMYWIKHGDRTRTGKNGANGRQYLVLDDEVFPLIFQSMRGDPVGVVEVPVTVKALDLGFRLNTHIVAGSMGMTVKAGGRYAGSVVQPCSGWFMLEYGRETWQ
jgi:hypothetical protein